VAVAAAEVRIEDAHARAVLAESRWNDRADDQARSKRPLACSDLLPESVPAPHKHAHSVAALGGVACEMGHQTARTRPKLCGTSR
jgi:hypothetical protein